ncbi:DUF5320 family protein [Patescibacteria group bacterium]|nr:DUF5320 family protein [Patescibacteria group bacterium]MBU0964381.1 DUF5320 family protein [Patescibacteria group bacterium]
MPNYDGQGPGWGGGPGAGWGYGPCTCPPLASPTGEGRRGAGRGWGRGWRRRIKWSKEDEMKMLEDEEAAITEELAEIQKAKQELKAEQ